MRASKGLGDAIYMRAVVLHLIEAGEAVEVFTQWREVFDDLPIKVRALSDATGDEDWHSAKACLHCRILRAPDVFAMTCLQAGVSDLVRLRLDWRVRNHDLTARVRREARGRPVLVFQPLKLTRNVNDRLSRPRAEAYATALEHLTGLFRVRLGHPSYTEETPLPCDLDLFGAASVTDALDVCTVADRFFGEPSYITAVAEALDKPVTCMFSRRAIASGRVHIANVTPVRLFHKPHLATSIYDEESACAS